MSYIFAGILSNQVFKKQYPEDSKELVFRKINHNQVKSGVLFVNQANEQIDKPNRSTDTLVENLKDIGITDGIWIYYCCWGGDIDCVATAKLNNSTIDTDSYSLIDTISYKDLHKVFSKFGIMIDKTGNFEPFVRNYWGEYGY